MRASSVTVGQHQCGRNATRINSDDAFVQADDHLRNSPDFEANKAAAEAAQKPSFTVERPLDEIYGDNYQDNVSGVTRNGSNKFPTGNPPGSQPPTPTNFENGTMKGIYRQNPDGSWDTHTMYPEPAPQGTP